MVGDTITIRKDDRLWNIDGIDTDNDTVDLTLEGSGGVHQDDYPIKNIKKDI